jgi:RNA polymerase subunit RPABC4/transcription elongation factor Spt4
LARKSVCVRCGAFKKDATATCPSCHYTPESEYQIARSLILSENSPIGDAIVGRDRGELKAIAKDIADGRPYYFDAEEQQQVVEAYRAHLTTNTKQRSLGFLRWLIPLLLIFGLVAALVWPA